MGKNSSDFEKLYLSSTTIRLQVERKVNQLRIRFVCVESPKRSRLSYNDNSRYSGTPETLSSAPPV